MTTEWYRNTTWNEGIEKAFNEKLRRARRKEQYLRIQASTLARSLPAVALSLLDRYFELPDDFDHAQAHVDRATAFVALGRLADAVAAYEAALSREAVFPRLQTQAYLDLPFLIATHELRDHYDRAVDLLSTHQARLMFPVDHFRWHAAQALIAVRSHNTEAAKAHAKRALAAASRDHSGFRHNPAVGLVTDRYDGVLGVLRSYL